ncbi:MobA/MobL family protein [Herminiimonas contaminans]|uniref:MobA/MobL family protein n=1 Tax=Herminiimonas contaminans TaxID=1111140 RepID=A0ABS0EUG4_9BURK|nr:MobA/MobL family protein [Herminiimonas contaminans]MBF8178370.1 MobA/MobL family protein [Herminiimonas contaminans]
MASFHHCIKSGKKGTAANHAAYISRKGKYNQRDDLVATGHGNMPKWANDDPHAFWKAGDKHERANGAVYREHEIALPSELTPEQTQVLVGEYIEKIIVDKPYEYAIHKSPSSIQGATNVHLHLMFSDRLPDGIDRKPEELFKRYNTKHPENGGCKKDSGGKSRVELREEIIKTRQISAGLQNAVLERNGHSSRVDHRSLKDQGIARRPERHLGPARVQAMTGEQKENMVKIRAACLT